MLVKIINKRTMEKKIFENKLKFLEFAKEELKDKSFVNRFNNMVKEAVLNNKGEYYSIKIIADLIGYRKLGGK